MAFQTRHHKMPFRAIIILQFRNVRYVITFGCKITNKGKRH
jgi:hypothetical protein